MLVRLGLTPAYMYPIENSDCPRLRPSWMTPPAEKFSRPPASKHAVLQSSAQEKFFRGGHRARSESIGPKMKKSLRFVGSALHVESRIKSRVHSWLYVAKRVGWHPRQDRPKVLCLCRSLLLPGLALKSAFAAYLGPTGRYEYVPSRIRQPAGMYMYSSRLR
jgi:hypothetical protein|eukprot:COSAG01_NODE_8396_length_2800_cov_68.858201_2_plen_162_part_00